MYQLREGTPSLIQIVSCCAAGTFKGFAMLRQLTGASQHLLGLANPVYVKGHGFLPAGQGHPVQSVGQAFGASSAFGTSTLASGDLRLFKQDSHMTSTRTCPQAMCPATAWGLKQVVMQAAFALGCIRAWEFEKLQAVRPHAAA